MHEGNVVHETEILKGDGGKAFGVVWGGRLGRFGDEWEGRPVEVDLAEPALFGDEGGDGGGGLVENVRGIRGEGVVEGVCGGELEVGWGFDDDVPAIGRDGVGTGGGAEDLCAVEVGVGGELEGVLLLHGAPAPEGDEGGECEDGPASSTVGFAADADFGVDEAEEGWGNEREEQDHEDDWLEDEDDGACVPAGVEREEGSDSVVVGPVKQDVAEEGDEREGVEESPADGSAVIT